MLLMRNQYPFNDPSLRLVLSAEGDEPPPAGGAGGDPPKGDGTPPPGETPPSGDPKGAAGASDDEVARLAADRAAGWTPEALEKQVARQHRKLKEQDAELAQLREIATENRRLKELAEAAVRRIPGDTPPAGDPPPRQPAAPAAPAETTDINTIRAQERFNIRVEELQSVLMRDHKQPWQTGLANLQRVAQSAGDEKAAVKVVEAVISAALETDDPAYVLVEACKDPSKLQDLVEMAPSKRLATMLRLGLAKDAPPPKSIVRPSGAPPPPSSEHQRGGADAPIGGNLYDEKYEFKNYFRGPDSARTEQMTDAEWHAERNRQKRESQGRPWSLGRGGGAGR